MADKGRPSTDADVFAVAMERGRPDVAKDMLSRVSPEMRQAYSWTVGAAERQAEKNKKKKPGASKKRRKSYSGKP